jgi:3-isopropylmalate dehydrogenase
VLSVALMLEHLGQTAAAGKVLAAVEADLAARGSAARSTHQIGDAIAARVAG